jgi:ATP/maltotriose-dependent transcriptional regulator MalT
LAQKQATELAEQNRVCQLDCWPPFIRFYQAAINAARGEAEAVERMSEAFDDIKIRNVRIHFSLNLAMLADAALSHGRLDVAQTAADEAESCLYRDEQWARSELLRVIGLTRWREGNVSSAIEFLKMAMRAAQENGALSFELRVAISHARLALQTEQVETALDQLASVYKRFDGDFDSSDLMAARELLKARRIN